MRIERDGINNTLTIHPEAAQHSATVLILHGLGDSSDGFADVTESLHRMMPHIKFILPTAESNPVTLNGGMRMPSWYDIVGLDDRSAENVDGIDKSMNRITGILDSEAAAVRTTL
jgi:lysophospholipase II